MHLFQEQHCEEEVQQDVEDRSHAMDTKRHPRAKRLAKTKIGAEKIAKQLKRTTGATIAMAPKHGISLSTR